jgi:3D (Asp-Asp-Asp) domain-containing protein
MCLNSLNAATNYTATVTAYCPCKKCCGPNAKGITASGKKAVEGITIAASRSIPFGTKINIPGLGVRVVQDRLAKKYDDRIDVFFNDHEKALKFGKKILTVTRF